MSFFRPDRTDLDGREFARTTAIRKTRADSSHLVLGVGNYGGAHGPVYVDDARVDFR